MFTVTVVPPGTSGAVPESVGVESFVDRVAPPVIVTVGAVVSMVKACVALPVLLAGSVAEATTIRVPSATVAAVTVHVPPV
jgi:hypothetical protein